MMKTIGTRIYSPRTNSEGKDYSLGWNKNKIYCMLILHQIKVMTNNGFLHTTYSSWKGLRSGISQTWEGLHEPLVGLKRTNEIDMITKEKEFEWTTVKIQK